MVTKILKYVIFDLIRSKVVLVYMLILFLLTLGFIYFQNDTSRTVSSLQYLILSIVPLISIILSTIQYYNSKEFVELLMTQPIRRRQIFMAEYLGISLVLSFALLVGLGVPLLFHGLTLAGFYLLFCGVILTFVFTGLAFLASVLSNDKAKGIGMALIVWFYFSIIYDGLVLAAMFMFNDYPLEKPVLLLTALNPIDLSRIVVLLKTDISALLGYTGALYQKFFGQGFGIIFSFVCLLLWTIVPLGFAVRKFARKDF